MAPMSTKKERFEKARKSLNSALTAASQRALKTMDPAELATAMGVSVSSLYSYRNPGNGWTMGGLIALSVAIDEDPVRMLARELLP